MKQMRNIFFLASKHNETIGQTEENK